MQDGRFSSWQLILVVGFVTCLLAANIVAVKLIAVAGFILPAAIIVFPVSYILGDVATEVYGFRFARRMIWLGFFANLTVVAAIAAAQALPAASFWDAQPAFDLILGAAPRILLASFIAYLVGEFVNSTVLARMKVWSDGRQLWLRTIGSTLVAQAFDSALFLGIAFAGTVPLSVLGGMILTQWLAKSAYEAAATPATYALVHFLKRREGIDVFDRETRFRPLAFLD